MSIALKAVLSIIEKIIPTVLAESWDNVGLQIGDPAWPIKTVRVALDPTPEVVRSACRDGVDLLVTHHPLIFKPLSQIDLSTPQGDLLGTAISNRMAIYAAHTNYDRLAGGLNDILAQKIDLLDVRPLESELEIQEFTTRDGYGLGRIGTIENAVTLKQLARRLKNRLGLDHVKIAGRSDLSITTIALCTGSGSSMLDLFINSGAQVYISGDLRYHDARTVETYDLGLIDVGHFSSEHLMVEALTLQLDAAMKDNDLDVAVTACQIELDPFVLV